MKNSKSQTNPNIRNSKLETRNYPEQKAYAISVQGDVQGVNFRYFAKKTAKTLGLVGWTKNEHDGTVSVFIQGDPEMAQKFIDWAKSGSPMAMVESVSVDLAETDEGLKDFEVR
jgi:acylphosphatase